MSLYDDASLIMYPSGVKASKIYSQKPTDGSGDLTFSRASTATRVNSSGLIEAVASNVPRIDYTGGGCGKLLLEPQRTNLAIVDTFSVYAGASVSSETVTNPEGTTSNVYSILGVGGFRYNGDISFVVGNNYVCGHFMKYNGVAVTLTASPASGTIISANGTFGFDSGGTPSKSGDVDYIEYPNGWYYVYAEVTCISSGATKVNFGISSGSILVWKSQYELGSYPTSYIPTAGSTVTRVADNAYSSTDASLFNSLEGTLFLQAEALINGGSNRYLTISNGTVSTYVRISYATATGYITAQLYNGGVVQASYDYLTTQNQNNKIAVKYGTNIFQFWFNGTKVYEKTSSVTPPTSGTFNVLKFSRGDGIDWMYAKIQGLLYFPTALSDVELEYLTGTSYNSYELMAVDLGYTVL